MEISATGQRVVVTAGGSGIGRAIAQLFHADGARAHACDVVADYLADARARLPVLGAMLAYVRKPEDLDRLFDAAVGAMGGIGVLINNAGIAGPAGIRVSTILPRLINNERGRHISGQHIGVCGNVEYER